jgi:hypothetical protein
MANDQSEFENTQTNIASELKQVQLETAKINLEIKRKELKHTPGWFRRMITTPAFLAAIIPAIITFCVTVAAIVIDNNKARQETNRSILLGIVNSGDTPQVASKLRLFLDTGLIYDQDGKIEATQRRLEDELRQEVFLNILRASREEPLRFDIIKMDSGFLQGFLKPIDLQTLDYLFRMGYPRELVLWMFADTFELKTSSATIQYQYSPMRIFDCPNADPEKRCFGDLVAALVVAGLSVEEVTVYKPSDGPHGTWTSYAQFCFNSAAGRPDQLAVQPDYDAMKAASKFNIPYSTSTSCGGEWDPTADAGRAQPETVPIHIGPTTLRIVSRPALAWFQFLGTLAKLQTDTPNVSTSKEVNIPKLYTVADDRNLLTIVRNQRDCFVQTKFHDQDYCVPDSAANTKRIFSMIFHLIGIQTVSSSMN